MNLTSLVCRTRNAACVVIAGLVVHTSVLAAPVSGRAADSTAAERQVADRSSRDAVGTGIGGLLGRLSRSIIDTTPGTVSYEGYLPHGGFARRFVAIRPAVAVANAPVLLLLHPLEETPEQTANVAAVGRLAAQHGAWVFLPSALHGRWNDGPRFGGPDDVGFLMALIDTSVATHALDASHVYVAGYSNGGFMAERLACERADRIAGIATVGAPLRDSIADGCALSRPMPVIQFHGTGDLIVPYGGGLRPGAVEGSRYWADRAGCTPGVVQSSLLPNRERRDRTQVMKLRYSGCENNVDVRLYTINGGGHTWPGSEYATYSAALGRTTGDVDATLELWSALIPFSRPPR